MGASKGNSNAQGGKGGRSYPARDVAAIYAVLDKALPTVIAYCLEVVERAKLMPDSKEMTRLGIDASKILISKMPERLTGEDGGPVQYNITWNG